MQSILEQIKRIRFYFKGHYQLIVLAFIILLAAYLRFYLLGSAGLGNMYYATAVKSMLTSWHNFFFVAYEPGGSISIDKPPVGFWLEAASTLVFGFNGFALAFPNALAGVLSIPLIFILVNQVFGVPAGLVSALVLAVNPVSVVVERNNDIDGLLTFVLLMSAYFFWRSVNSDKVRFLLIGAFLVGIGFNIKMLEAFLPLPAFYLLYLFGAKQKWWNRILQLFLAGIVILTISFSWAVIVDSIPAADRPFVGSSRNNSVVDLALNYNGLERLIPGGSFANLFKPDATPTRPVNAIAALDPTTTSTPAPQDNQAGLTPEPQNTVVLGEPGLMRMFTLPIAENISWFLPVAFFTIILVLAYFLIDYRKRANRSEEIGASNSAILQALVLWGGWLIIEFLFFSFSTGNFHFYYFATMAPPLAGLVGALVGTLINIIYTHRWLGWVLVLLAVSITALFQVSIMLRYDIAQTMIILICTACLIGIGLLAWKPKTWPAKIAIAFLSIGLLAAPFLWSISITLMPMVDNTQTPTAYKTSFKFSGSFQPLLGGSITIPPLLDTSNLAFVKFLEEKKSLTGYLVAVDSSPQADPIILLTNLPVLVIGGYVGNEHVITPIQIAQIVEKGELRFIITDTHMEIHNPRIFSWVKLNCSQILFPTGDITYPLRTYDGGQTLYNCNPLIKIK